MLAAFSGKIRASPFCGKFRQMQRRRRRFRGNRIKPEDIVPYNGLCWGRLSPGSGRTTRGWFRQDRPLIERMTCWSHSYTPEEVVSLLTALFAEVEEFWASGRLGPHVRLLPLPAPSEPIAAGGVST
jgi:hypothetical protein